MSPNRAVGPFLGARSPGAAARPVPHARAAVPRHTRRDGHGEGATMRRDEGMSGARAGDEKTRRSDAAKLRDQAGRDETKREDMFRDAARK